MREKIADLIWRCTDNYEAFEGDHACSGESFNEDKFLNEILTLISEEIEKVENPYAGLDERLAFEKCRQEFLSLLKE